MVSLADIELDVPLCAVADDPVPPVDADVDGVLVVADGMSVVAVVAGVSIPDIDASAVADGNAVCGFAVGADAIAGAPAIPYPSAVGALLWPVGCVAHAVMTAATNPGITGRFIAAFIGALLRSLTGTPARRPIAYRDTGAAPARPFMQEACRLN